MGAEPECLSFDELEEELATLASHIYAGTSRWLTLVAELDRRGELACTSSEWLAWRCGLTPRTAREHVRIARRLRDLPLIRAAFARGEVSFAKVRALTRIAQPESEEGLLELALAMTAAQLERTVRAYRCVTTEEALSVQENAFFHSYWDEDGSLVLQGRLAPEDGAVFLQALDAARERGSAEPQPTNADALVAMAEASLSGTARSGGERYQVVVHVDEAALGEGGCDLEEGPSLAPETVRRLACDASLVQIEERAGKTLSVGRKTRSIPPALRRALKRRDRGCRFPGCENHRFVDAHHIRHWAQGGETKLDNLVLLCRRHHRLVHEGGYSVDRLRGDGLRFRAPRGAPIPDAPGLPGGSLDRLLELGTGSYGTGAGDRMDRRLAVEALLAAQPSADHAVPDRGDEAGFVAAPVRLG
jgi:hypothetical protein